MCCPKIIFRFSCVATGSRNRIYCEYYGNFAWLAVALLSYDGVSAGVAPFALSLLNFLLHCVAMVF